jgi:hypothetical protein
MQRSTYCHQETFDASRTTCTAPAAGPPRGTIMSALDWLILLLVVLAIVAAAVLVRQRRRRVGGVIATKSKP